MKPDLRALVISIGLFSSVSAAVAESPSGWQGFVVGGLTKGGDPMYTTVTVDTDRHQHVYAGNMIQVGAGLMWTAEGLPLSVALSVNYHVDDATGANGSGQFKRTPVEAIAYYVNESRDWRAGIGMRYVMNPNFDSKFETDNGTSQRAWEFRDTKGLVAETGWRFGNHIWLNLRVVKEVYERQSGHNNGVPIVPGDKYNGSHVGASFLYAF